MRSELYVSTDVETDGPIPGPHSRLSFASVAFVLELSDDRPAGWREVGDFSRNLATVPGSEGAPVTMALWRDHPAAWEATRVDPQPPETALREYVAWLEALEREAVRCLNASSVGRAEAGGTRSCSPGKSGYFQSQASPHEN